ncbi:MAG: DsrE family protein [Gammaproteobacteria bacterium]|nr:DsrE family protein [Gammaproteobacteria bacterium]
MLGQIKRLVLSVLFILYVPCVMALGVDELLAENARPEGVVFEVVSKDPALLQVLLPRLQDDINRLRRHYPGLPLAVVSHGREQFALLSKDDGKKEGLHELVRQMVKQQGVEVHVCGTYAERYGYLPEDFPEYVDVSAEGPAQINDYRELGYRVVRYR